MTPPIDTANLSDCVNTLIPEGPEGSNSVNFFQSSPFLVIVLVLLSFFDSNGLYECGGAFLDF